ncbi:MAG: cytochrome c [Bacteroidota bacterium]
MRYLLFVVVLAFSVFACGGEPPREQKADKKVAKKKKKVDGEKVFKQYCVTCHGVYGDMGANGAFNLATSELTVEEKINVITNGRNTMTSFKGLLNEAKIKAVAEYTEKLKK